MLARFFRPYLRRYAAWGLLAGLAVPVYGLASAGMVALIEPIFDEVLLAGDPAPDAEVAGPAGPTAVPRRTIES